MSVVSEQARNKDAGVPSSDNPGGYAERVSNPPANTVLSESDQQHNSQGSFYYPPSVRSAAQTIEFWENVDIDDEVLANFESAYYQRIEAAKNAIIDERVRGIARQKMDDYLASEAVIHQSRDYQRDWKNANEIQRTNQRASELEMENHNRGVFREQAEREVAPLTDIEVEEIEGRWPHVSKPNVRPLVRAAGMYAYTPTIPERIDPSERQKVMDHQVEMAYGELKSVADIEREFQLDELGALFFEKR